MKTITSWGRAAGLGVALTLTACGSFEPVPVPAGYLFPTWQTGGQGASALLEGILIDKAGCLFVQPAARPGYFVIWPDRLHLELDADGVPVVKTGDAVAARVGGQERLGGGELGEAARPAGTDRCTDHCVPVGGNDLVRSP